MTTTEPSQPTREQLLQENAQLTQQLLAAYQSMSLLVELLLFMQGQRSFLPAPSGVAGTDTGNAS